MGTPGGAIEFGSAVFEALCKHVHFAGRWRLRKTRKIFSGNHESAHQDEHNDHCHYHKNILLAILIVFFFGHNLKLGS